MNPWAELLKETELGWEGDPAFGAVSGTREKTPVPAQRVSLTPLPLEKRQGGNPWACLFRRWFSTQKADPVPYHRLLEGRQLMAGDVISATWAGGEIHLQVSETAPAGRVTMLPSTELLIQGVAYRQAIGGYAEVGGLSQEVARVREMVELPLRFPELFEHLGVDPPKGLLLYGPPGCGKTLIARAVAQESGAHFISINGPEIIQKHYGASEEVLRSIFEEASKHPSTILFFDEIDAIAPNRETVLGDVEKRVVAQLLSLMDGLRSRGRIVVIAATNLPNNIDPALRRPGRFDREISINPPDRRGRLEILRIHTRGMPLAEDVDLEDLATRTHGFLGADLAALCREAAMVCARQAPKHLGLHQAVPSNEVYLSLKVMRAHFEIALGEIDLSTTRQLSTEVADLSWEDVGGLEELKKVLIETVEWPLKYGERFSCVRAMPPKGVLLTGAPGTGKTLLARAAAAESGVNFITVKGPELLSKWVGESERGIREIFKRARQSAPSIVFFDELDALLPVRGTGEGGAHVGERMVGQFLLEMDSLEAQHGVVVLGATNRPELIDVALLRPGRFDLVMELPLPDLKSRQAILDIHCRGRAIGRDIDLAALARRTVGFSGADLESLCRKAALMAIRESVEAFPGDSFPRFQVEMEHFDAALVDASGPGISVKGA